MRRDGIRSWLPSTEVAIFLGVWAVVALVFVGVAVPAWARDVRVTTCSEPETPSAVADARLIGEPDPGARLAPSLGIARGTAEDSVSWPTAAGAPNGLFRAGSSALLPDGGGRILTSRAVRAWVAVDNGTAVLTVCVDSAKAAGLDHGKFAGFAFVPTSDPAKTLTVRHEVSVQSAYVGLFWPLSFLVVGLGVALAGDRLRHANKPVKWLALIGGFGTFAGAYYANALSNPTWGGLEAVGALLVTTFTATVGATSAATATAPNPTEPPAQRRAEPPPVDLRSPPEAGDPAAPAPTPANA